MTKHLHHKLKNNTIKNKKFINIQLWAERLAKKLENSNVKAIVLNKLLSPATLKEIDRQINSKEA